MKRFIEDVGIDEAGGIAEFYVHHPNAWFLKNSHDPVYLAKDAHTLRTQWLSGRQVTTIDAREGERLGTFRNSVRVVKDMVSELDARDAQGKRWLQ